MDTRIYNDLSVYGSITFAVNESELPTNPADGQIVYMNGRHYAYTRMANNYFSWMPIASSPQSSYIHTQGVASSKWIIAHNLNTTEYGLFVYDADHNIVIVNHKPINSMTVEVNLTSAITGTAVFFAVTDFSVTNFTASAFTLGDVTLTASNGTLLANGSTLVPTTLSGVENLEGTTGLLKKLSDGIFTLDTSPYITVESVPYDIASAVIGKPSGGATFLRFAVVKPFSTLANSNFGIFRADSSATGTVWVYIKKNGVQIGTVLFSPGSTTGSITVPQTNWDTGDSITIVYQSVSDPTLSDLHFTIAGQLL